MWRTGVLGTHRLVVPLDAEPTPVRPARRGEGPVWDDEAGELLWVDTAGQVRWSRVDPAGAVSDLAVRPIGEPVGAVALTTGPGWLVAVDGGFRSLTPDGRVGALLDIAGERGGPGRMRAGACDRAGRFFAGAAARDELPGAASLYRVDLDGVVSTALSGLTAPTGIAWSPDDDVLYLVDSGERTVTAYDYDADLGTLDRPRVLLTFPADAPGTPHGLTVDRAGHLWVAVWGGGQVRRYSAGGMLEEVVRVRAGRTSGCVFAGPGLDTLVVTTWSAEGLPLAEQAIQPDAGRLFTARVPDVVGRGALRYRGPLRALSQV